MLNLDTHILIDLMIGHLTSKETKQVKGKTWCISGIVLWELFKLNQLGRVQIDFSHPEIKQFLNSLKVLPLDLDVVKALENLDFKSDPADEIIAATSIAFNIPLLTRDKKIRKSKLTPLAISQ